MEKKIFYLDNLRLTLAVFVVAWHSANAYIGIDWSVTESDISYFVYFFKTIFDVFTMPLFFYISGYFAFSSVKKYGSTDFIKNKAKSILLPWVAGIVLIVPLIKMIGQVSRNAFTEGYFELWKHEMSRLFQFNIGLVGDHYYQRYMWFLSLLFVMFCLLALWYVINKRWFVQAEMPTQKLFEKKDSVRFWIKTFLLFFIPMLFVQVIVLIFANSSDAEPFISLFNLIQFQSTRLPVYIIIFVLGLLTKKNHWIERGLFDQSNWVFVFAITCALYLFHTNVLNHILPDMLFGPLFVIFITMLIASCLGFCMYVFKKYFDKPIAWDVSMPSLAFDIYILHYPIVYFFQALFLKAGSVPYSIKFFAVTIISLALSYVFAKWVMKPHPKVALSIGIIGTLLLFAVT